MAADHCATSSTVKQGLGATSDHCSAVGCWLHGPARRHRGHRPEDAHIDLRRHAVRERLPLGLGALDVLAQPGRQLHEQHLLRRAGDHLWQQQLLGLCDRRVPGRALHRVDEVSGRDVLPLESGAVQQLEQRAIGCPGAAERRLFVGSRRIRKGSRRARGREIANRCRQQQQEQQPLARRGGRIRQDLKAIERRPGVAVSQLAVQDVGDLPNVARGHELERCLQVGRRDGLSQTAPHAAWRRAARPGAAAARPLQPEDVEQTARRLLPQQEGIELVLQLLLTVELVDAEKGRRVVEGDHLFTDVRPARLVRAVILDLDAAQSELHTDCRLLSVRDRHRTADPDVFDGRRESMDVWSAGGGAALRSSNSSRIPSGLATDPSSPAGVPAVGRVSGTGAGAGTGGAPWLLEPRCHHRRPGGDGGGEGGVPSGRLPSAPAGSSTERPLSASAAKSESLTDGGMRRGVDAMRCTRSAKSVAIDVASANVHDA
eukprot:2698545-Prymnesium_polylepis.1